MQLFTVYSMAAVVTAAGNTCVWNGWVNRKHCEEICHEIVKSMDRSSLEHLAMAGLPTELATL